jgi:hypothetical protein
LSESVHVHAPHELTEHEDDGSSDGSTHRLELVATLLLALATLGIAWSGYQAARWSGFQSELYASATHTRTVANRVTTRTGQSRLQDLLNFNRWLETTTEGDTTLSDLYVRRFRPQFRPAFEAWLAQDPLSNRQATASPLYMPQYRLPGFERAARLDRRADREFEEARDATTNTDDYVLITVFLAIVLFFAGISLRFTWTAMRISVLAIGAVVLAFAAVRLLALPIH